MNWKRIVIPALFFSCLGLSGIGCSGTNNASCKQIIEELRTMVDTTIMDYGDYDIMLPPSMYAQWAEMNNIFAVPEDNMVGTNDLDNAIKLLEFKTDEDLKQHIVKKDFMEEVTGAYYFRFMPVWSEKEIAYAQSKGFLIVSIPEQKVEIHTISPGIYTGNIENLAILDAEKRIFVMEIDRPYAKVQGFHKLIKVIRFENNSFTVLAEHPAGVKTGVYTEPWFVYQKKIFTYNDSTTKLEVFDENFNTTNHPLAEAFNRNQVGFRCMQEIVIHPILPFALIIEKGKMPSKNSIDKLLQLPAEEKRVAVDTLLADSRRKSLYLFRWSEPDEKKQLLPLISIAGSIWHSYNPANKYSHLTFSPDGKWLVFRDGTMRGTNTNSNRNPVFVAVPIDEKNPMLLGKPVKLGYAMRDGALEPKSTAWSTKPTAFTMCDGLVLYRWNLDRYRQPNTQKVKMPPGATDPFIK